MVSHKIQNLSLSDLNYLDKLLHREFSKQNDQISTWKSKNHYQPISDKTATLRRLMEAVQSQRRIAQIDKW